MKKFVCIWVNDFVFDSVNTIETENADIFLTANGYSQKDRDDIDGLEVGQMYQDPEGFDHFIVRIG